MLPIIDSVVLSPTALVPGTTFTLTVNAHDPGTAKAWHFTGTVTDPNGNAASFTADSVADSGVLTYAAAETTGTIKLTPDATLPNVFHGTV